jgi:hypothetical protein
MYHHKTLESSVKFIRIPQKENTQYPSPNVKITDLCRNNSLKQNNKNGGKNEIT